MITIVGLGNNDGDITLKGACAIDEADLVVVKTAMTDTYKYFEDIAHITCDNFYENSQDFEQLNTQLAAYVVSEGKQTKVAYCVNGSGYDDRSVAIIKALDSSACIISSVGRESIPLSALPTTGYAAISVYDLDDLNFDYDSTVMTLIIKDIDSEFAAERAKTFLSRSIGEESQIAFYNGAECSDIAVYELDRQTDYSYLCSACVRPIELTAKAAFNYIDIMRIMRRLRADDGCEWDKAQTHESIRNNAIEEAYELVDAINSQDIDNIIEESGDVILQGLFHTIIGEDEGEFEAYEVLSTLGRKLVTRHPHVFGDVKADNAQDALNSWTAAKAKEKKTKTTADKMRSVVGSLPQLIRAEKLQNYVKNAGMDIPNTKAAAEKVTEELAEMLSAKGSDIETECGDLLFAVVNLARLSGIAPELALAKSNEKFINRSAFVFDKIKELGLDIAAMSDEELNSIWLAAKCKGL